MNRCMLMGRLGKEPELRHTANDVRIANFSLATSTRYKGEQKTQWHSCVAFGNVAENIAKHLTKGDQLACEGEIQYEQWEDKNTGEKRYGTKILIDRFWFVGGKSASKQEPEEERAQGPAAAPEEDFDEDVPF